MEQDPITVSDEAVEPMEECLYGDTLKVETLDDTNSELQNIVADAAYSSDMTLGAGFQQEEDPIQQAPVQSSPVQPKSILKNKTGEPWRKKSNDKEKVDLACDICDLKFTSWVIANDHLNGKKHAKRLRLTQTNKDKPHTPAPKKTEPVVAPVVKTTPEIPEKTGPYVPSRAHYRQERLRSFKERTVLAWPIIREDLNSPKLLEVVENCYHWYCRFYTHDRVDNKSIGNLEVRFKTVQDAEEGAKKLSALRDEVKVEGGTSTSLIVKRLDPTDTIDRTIFSMKGSQPKGSFEYRTVFVGSLPPAMTEEKLNSYFPTATSVLIPRDENNVQKGYAYIEYDSAEQATAVTNNMSSLNIDGQTVSVLNFFLASDKHTNKPGKRPLSPRASAPAAQGSSPAQPAESSPSQPAAKKQAVATEKKESLPAGAMSAVKRQILMAKLKSLKKNMRKNAEVRSNPELRKMLRNWHMALQRDVDTRKKCNLPNPGPLPEDPDKEFGPVRSKYNSRGQGQDYPPAKRAKRGGGGTGWQQRGGRFANRNWQNTASSTPDYNANQTANAVNLLMGLTQALSGQSNTNFGGSGRGRGSTGYQGKQGGLGGSGGLGGGRGASGGFQGKQQRMLPNIKPKGKKPQQGGSGGRYQPNPTQMMGSQDSFGAAAVSDDSYKYSNMGTGQQDYSDGGYSGGGYTDTSYNNDYSMDTSNTSYQENWDMQYDSGMNTDSNQQNNRNTRGGYGRGQSWY